MKPPDLTALGDVKDLEKPKKKKAQKYRRVHAEEIQAKGQEESIWPVSPTKNVKVDKEFSDWFLDSFRLKSPIRLGNRRVGKEKKRRDSKEIVVEVCDDQRRQNISIPLRKIGVDTKDLIQALVQIDDKVLTEENLDRISKMVPTEREMKDITSVLLMLQRKHFKRRNTLGERLIDNEELLFYLPKEEQVLVRLARIDNVSERIKLLLFTHHFPAEIANVIKMVETVRKGITQVSTAVSDGHLRRVLNNVLHLVNMLNETKLKGFRISTLSKLSSTKMTRGKGTLMDAVVMLSMSVDQNCNVSGELHGLEDASSVDFQELQGLITNMDVNMTLTKDTIAKLEESGKDEPFLSKLRGFHETEVLKLNSVHADVKKVQEDFESLRQKFHEPDMSLEDFFTTFIAFRKDFTSSQDEAERKKRRAERRRREEEMKSKIVEQRKARRFSTPAKSNGPDIEIKSFTKVSLKKRSLRDLPKDQSGAGGDGGSGDEAENFKKLLAKKRSGLKKKTNVLPDVITVNRRSSVPTRSRSRRRAKKTPQQPQTDLKSADENSFGEQDAPLSERSTESKVSSVSRLSTMTSRSERTALDMDPPSLAKLTKEEAEAEDEMVSLQNNLSRQPNIDDQMKAIDSFVRRRFTSMEINDDPAPTQRRRVPPSAASQKL